MVEGAATAVRIPNSDMILPVRHSDPLLGADLCSTYCLAHSGAIELRRRLKLLSQAALRQPHMHQPASDRYV
jgi:hypothetical protein